MSSIDPALQAHIDLKKALQEQGISGIRYKYSPSPKMQPGAIYNTWTIFPDVIAIIIPFATPAAAVAVLHYIRPLALKWLEVRAQRSIELKVETEDGVHSISIKGHADADTAIKALLKLDRRLKQEKKALDTPRA